jgi:hypothetical protein
VPTIRREAVEHQVRHRVAALRLQPYDALAALPEWHTERVPFGNQIASVTTYRGRAPDGRLEIVVQCLPDGEETGVVWRGSFADGFWTWPDGRVEALPDADRHYYM